MITQLNNMHLFFGGLDDTVTKYVNLQERFSSHEFILLNAYTFY